MSVARFVQTLPLRLPWAALLVAPLGLLACGPSDEPAQPIVYVCGSDPNLAFENTKDLHTCGLGDPNLPPEPTFPTEVCQTLVANKSTPDESSLDNDRVRAALLACKDTGLPVKLVADGPNNVFLTGHIKLDGVVLWVDEGVTLYASRDPNQYQSTGNCGVLGTNDSTACTDFITVAGHAPGIIGDGTIDGQGGEPLVGHDYSWWQMSGALRDVDGSIGNPTMINADKSVEKFLMYRITLHNSAKFHVKVSSSPDRTQGSTAACNSPGDGFIIWGVTVLTPSTWFNSQGLLMTPQFSRNSDGIDPGANDDCICGVIACSTISTGDDQIAIKGGHLVRDLVIAHNHFGTGHGMSIGSETMGDVLINGVKQPAISNLNVYDLTIDADSRWVGHRPSGADFNGIRIKSDISRGGTVTNLWYHDICMRDITNSILVSTAYNPLFSGKNIPNFGALTFQNIHGVTCMSEVPTVVAISGYNVNNPAGPVALDNVVFDNIGPLGTYSQFADITMGPGDVNFKFEGLGVKVTNNIVPGSSTPRECVFPTLPTPKKPDGWVW